MRKECFNQPLIVMKLDAQSGRKRHFTMIRCDAYKYVSVKSLFLLAGGLDIDFQHALLLSLYFLEVDVTFNYFNTLKYSTQK